MSNILTDFLKVLRGDSTLHGLFVLHKDGPVLNVALPETSNNRAISYQAVDLMRKAGLIAGEQRQMTPKELFAPEEFIPLGHDAAIYKPKDADIFQLMVDFSGKDVAQISNEISHIVEHAEQVNRPFDRASDNLRSVYEAVGLPNAKVKAVGYHYKVNLSDVDDQSKVVDSVVVMNHAGLLPREDVRYYALGRQNQKGDGFEIHYRIPEGLTPHDIQDRCYQAVCQLHSQNPSSPTLWTERVCSHYGVASGKPVGGSH